jgi:hypothetical protein
MGRAWRGIGICRSRRKTVARNRRNDVPRRLGDELHYQGAPFRLASADLTGQCDGVATPNHESICLPPSNKELIGGRFDLKIDGALIRARFSE